MGDPFHAPPTKRIAGNQLVATWNVGGMAPPKVMEFLQSIRGGTKLFHRASRRSRN